MRLLLSPPRTESNRLTRRAFFGGTKDLARGRDPSRYLLLSWPTKFAAIISWEVSIPIEGMNVDGIARHVHLLPPKDESEIRPTSAYVHDCLTNSRREFDLRIRRRSLLRLFPAVGDNIIRMNNAKSQATRLISNSKDPRFRLQYITRAGE